MAKRRGRGFATIEYPTGMNQNGDPTQAWIKLKPDGSVDVFAGTVDIGQGSKTVHTQIVADVLGLDPLELRLKNANRIGDTTGNRVVMHDPSTVAVTLAAADAAGYELGEEYRSMTSDRRTGDLLPEHLVAQQAPEGDLATYDPAGSNGGGN